MSDTPRKADSVLLDLPALHLPPVRAVGWHPLWTHIQAAGRGVRAARNADTRRGGAAAAPADGTYQPGAGCGE